MTAYILCEVYLVLDLKVTILIKINIIISK